MTFSSQTQGIAESHSILAGLLSDGLLSDEHLIEELFQGTPSSLEAKGKKKKKDKKKDKKKGKSNKKGKDKKGKKKSKKKGKKKK